MVSLRLKALSPAPFHREGLAYCPWSWVVLLSSMEGSARTTWEKRSLLF